MQSDKDKRREKDIVSLILMLLPLEIYLVPPSRARLEDQTHWETPTVSSAQCHTQTQVGPVSVMKSTEKLEKKLTSVFSYMLLFKVTEPRCTFAVASLYTDNTYVRT